METDCSGFQPVRALGSSHKQDHKKESGQPHDETRETRSAMRLTRREREPLDANHVPNRNGWRARMIERTEWNDMPALVNATDFA
jgi:hypothetical protein